VLVVIRRRAPAVILCVIIAIGAAVALTVTQPKKYTATASVLFNNTPLSQQVAGLQPVATNSAASQQDTNVQLLSLGDVPQKTASQVGHGLSKQAVSDSITIEPVGDTTVVNVSATMTSPALAAEVANTYAAIFVSEQENANHQYYSSALITVESQLAKLSPRQRQGAQGLALGDRAQSLATLSQLQSGTVQVAQAASVPTSPSSPRTKRDIAVAGILGLGLGLILALTIDRLDQRIREPEELEAIYGLPLLGVVPESPTLKRGLTVASPAGAAGDSFQFIRAHLRYFNVDRDLRTLAIVSGAPGEGKTTISYGLASAAAAMGVRVLVIETDLRRPTLAQQAGVEVAPGLADVVIGSVSLEDATQTISLASSASDPSGERSLDVLVAGALPPNPAEILESHAMEAVLSHAKATHELVVIDTPPLSAVSDAIPLLQKVDGVVMVASVGRSHRDAAKRLRETLSTLDAPLLGVIANRGKTRGGYGYGYGYGYESAHTAPPSQAPTGPVTV